ncbi:Zn-dependent oxidoreductase [Saccharopolyspora erythraea D]|nr:Zn-dependent oxidoreductase [Saccharopolyspora erythraea D]
MAAVLLTGHGGLDKLEYRTDVRVPHPKRGEVLVQVAAAGINNTDVNTRIGWYSRAVTAETGQGGAGGFDTVDDVDATWSGAALEFPRVQGADVCGRIVDVGEGVSRDRVGERVLVRNMLRTPVGYRPFECWTFGSECDGGFAQFAVAPSQEAHAVRCDWSDEELAAVPCAYSTAENMLHRAGVGAERVLVTGASGGVGLAAVQLAKRRGATVIAVCARPRVAGTAVRAVVDLVACEHRRDGRLAASEGLGQRDDVGGDPGVLEGEEPACSADTALHFVGDPQHPVAIAQPPDLLQVARRRQHHSGTALHGFQDQHADAALAAQQFLQRRGVAEGHGLAARQDFETSPVELRVGDRQRADRLAVEGVARVCDLGAARALCAFGELEGGLHRLRTAAVEHHAVQALRRQRGQVPRQSGDVLRRQGQRELVALLLLEAPADRQHARMVVPECHRAEPAEEVEDATAGTVHVVHVLGVVDGDPVESQQCERRPLARADVLPVDLGDRVLTERGRLVDAEQLRVRGNQVFGDGHGDLRGERVVRYTHLGPAGVAPHTTRGRVVSARLPNAVGELTSVHQDLGARPPIADRAASFPCQLPVRIPADAGVLDYLFADHSGGGEAWRPVSRRPVRTRLYGGCAACTPARVHRASPGDRAALLTMPQGHGVEWWPAGAMGDQ